MTGRRADWTERTPVTGDRGDRRAERMTWLKKDLSCLLHTKSPEINRGSHVFQTYMQLIYLSNQLEEFSKLKHKLLYRIHII